MLRITMLQQQAARVVLVLEGRLSGAWVEELRKVCAAAAGRVVLILTDVSGADEEGLKLLGELAAQGAELAGKGIAVRTLVEVVQRGR
jgi:anti-anti-sigma regulatory factor